MKLNNDVLATILGLGTTICTALAVIDWSTFNMKADWFKIIIIALPAIGGYYSKIKDKNENI